ncbi:MAG: radical SAM protein [Candidatus Omnitrophota bacterium]
MKILFIVKESTMHERMGIMCLSAALKERGHETRLVLLDTHGEQGTVALARSFAPGVVAYSVMTGEHGRMLAFNRLLKKEISFLAVFGGPHTTFFPDMIQEEGVDAICVGEADEAFPEFCRRVAEGGDYRHSPNFWCRHGAEVVKNPLAPLIRDLDTLPFADRAVMYEADPALRNEGRKMFFAARGCPQKCTYCFNSRYNDIYQGKGPVVRARSPESIVREIVEVKRQYPLNVVWIDDDNFLAKPGPWFFRFAALYKEQVGLPLSVNLRADFIKEEIIAALKGAGLDSAWMGIECGNEEKANAVLKRELTNAEIERGVAILHKHKVKIITQNLIGLPVADSEAMDLETLDFNIRLKPAFAWSSILYPYPGTAIEVYAREQGLLGKETLLLETNKRSTAFGFSPERVRWISNFHKLFGVVVRFPILRGGVGFLCRLPFGAFYTMVFYCWYGYNMKFRLYPFVSWRRELSQYVALWWRFIRKT